MGRRTIIECLEHHARVTPDSPLYSFLNLRGDTVAMLSYGDFHRLTNGLAHALTQGQGLGPSEPVLLVYPAGLDMIIAFVACVKLGALPIPVPPPSGTDGSDLALRIALIASDSRARRALTTGPLVKRLAAASYDLKWIATDRLGAPLDRFEGKPQELLFLQYTSGSTRSPRGVMVSHENVLHNCAATVDHIPRAVSWLPHFHDMGLIGCHLFPMIAGGSATHFAPADFLRRPLLWLETISRIRATSTTAPNFAFDYCLNPTRVPDEALTTLDLRSLRTVMNAAEPVRGDTMERFHERFARCGLDREALTVSYGLAENTLCASSGGRAVLRVSKSQLACNLVHLAQRRRADAATVSVASCGRPVEGVEVRIVDPETHREQRGDEVGEIWLAGPSRAGGYWRNPVLTRETFHARLTGDDSGTGYLSTGDMGFMREGELYVCGRIKDMVIVRGGNLFPTDVEAMAASLLPARDRDRIAAFAAPECETGEEGIILVVEARTGGQGPNLEALWHKIRRGLGTPVLALATVRRGTIPRTSSGKISRHRCQQMWLGGAFHTIDVFRPPTGDAGGIDGYFEQFGLDEDDAATPLGALGLDSFELVNLHLEIERFLKQHGTPIEGHETDLSDLRTLQALTPTEIRRMAADVKAGRPFAGFLIAAQRDAAAEDARRMQAESRLADDIVAALATPVRASKAPVAASFLTGATGFLGVHLLLAILAQGAAPVIAHVRADSDRHAEVRLEAALARAVGDEEAARLMRRIEVVRGDLALPRLGLSDGQWSDIAGRAGSIYHCGAAVDYVKTYADLAQANVAGTGDVLRLAAAGPPKMLHYISSTFIFGWTMLLRVFEDDGNDEMTEIDFGYAQTKWAAEQLVRQAIARGLAARIYRPALLTASSRGDYVREDVVARLLSYMIRNRLSVISDVQLSLLPIDVAANNIVAIAGLRDLEERSFHITADRHYTMTMLCQAISRRYGYEFEFVSTKQFIDHMVRHCKPGDVLYPLIPFSRRNREKIDRMRLKRYDNANYRRARALTPLTLPEPPLDDTAGYIVEFLLRDRLIQPRPRHGYATQEAYPNALLP